METKDYIANNLTYRTLASAQKYYTVTERGPVSIERAKQLLAEHIDQLLDLQFNSSLGRGEYEFEEASKEIIDSLPAMETKQREDLLSSLWGLYGTGLSAGYIAGMRDMEALLNALHPAERTENE